MVLWRDSYFLLGSSVLEFGLSTARVCSVLLVAVCFGFSSFYLLLSVEVLSYCPARSRVQWEKYDRGRQVSSEVA